MTANTDAFAGMGGSYVVDDATQTRLLVNRTDAVPEVDATNVPEPAAPPVAPSQYPAPETD